MITVFRFGGCFLCIKLKERQQERKYSDEKQGENEPMKIQKETTVDKSGDADTSNALKQKCLEKEQTKAEDLCAGTTPIFIQKKNENQSQICISADK